MAGTSPALHLLTISLHTWITEIIEVGLVAAFKSVKPLPQAEDATSHMNVKIPVTSRS